MNFPIRVYYENTDAGGVVYHAQYLNFFERARTEFLRDLGFSQQILLEQDLAFVVKKLDIDYKVPARLDEQLIVETEVKQIKKASIIFEQKLWRHDICLCQANVLVAAVNLAQMKPIAIPDYIHQVMKAVE